MIKLLGRVLVCHGRNLGFDPQHASAYMYVCVHTHTLPTEKEKAPNLQKKILDFT